MWHRLHVQEVCEVAFFRTANNQALRRQILSKTRPQPGPFEPGAWLMYWRTGGLKKDLQGYWHGPAQNIGRDDMGYWLIHNGIPIFASPNLLRYATLSDKEIHEKQRQQRMIAGSAEETRGRIAGQRGFIDLSNQSAPHEEPARAGMDVETENMRDR